MAPTPAAANNDLAQHIPQLGLLYIGAFALSFGRRRDDFHVIYDIPRQSRQKTNGGTATKRRRMVPSGRIEHPGAVNDGVTSAQCGAAKSLKGPSRRSAFRLLDPEVGGEAERTVWGLN